MLRITLYTVNCQVKESDILLKEGERMATDRALMQAIKMGDQAAFEAFIHRYHAPVLTYVEHLLHNREKAEDIVQETFLKLLVQLRDRAIPDHVAAWLYRVAANLCRDYWKSAGYRREKPVLDQAQEQSDRHSQVIEICERRETRMEIIMLLNELPESQRKIVILRFYRELKLQEIANITECPLGTVKSRLFHALRLLKSRIEESGEVGHGYSGCARG